VLSFGQVQDVPIGLLHGRHHPREV
jgi:hypothetical protein